MNLDDDIVTQGVNRPYISNSQLEMFLRCGEQYRRRYICGERIPPGLALIRGSAIHTAAEVNHRQKMTTRRDMRKSDLVEIAASDFDARLSKDGVVLSDDENDRGREVVVGEEKDVVVNLTDVYADMVAPSIMPAMVEERITMSLPSSPADMLGIIDVATEGGRIIDLKSSKKKKTQRDADDSTQLTWYAMAYQARTGAPPTGIDMVALVNTKRPEAQTLSTTRTRKDMEVLVARVNNFLGSRQAGSFSPAPVGSWWCSSKFCGYWNTCPFVNSERQAAAE